MKKKLPKLRSDREAEDFVAKADLAAYDLSGMRTARFEFQPKSELVNIRLPKPLLQAVKRTVVRFFAFYGACPLLCGITVEAAISCQPSACRSS